MPDIKLNTKKAIMHFYIFKINDRLSVGGSVLEADNFNFRTSLT